MTKTFQKLFGGLLIVSFVSLILPLGAFAVGVGSFGQPGDFPGNHGDGLGFGGAGLGADRYIENLNNAGSGNNNTTNNNNNNSNTSSCSSVYVSGTGLGGILDLIGCLLRGVIPILVTSAIIVFIYGIVTYIRNADNAEKRKEGNLFMLYGLIALFVMVSIWALVGILGATLGVDAVLPQLPE